MSEQAAYDVDAASRILRERIAALEERVARDSHLPPLCAPSAWMHVPGSAASLPPSIPAGRVERVDALNALAEALDDIQLERALDLFRQAGELARPVYIEGLAASLSGQAKIQLNYSRFEEASRLCFEVLALVAPAASSAGLDGHPPGVGGTEAGVCLAWLYYYLGEFSSALEWGLKGLEMARAAGARGSEASALDIIAGVHSAIGDHLQAVADHSEALRIAAATGDPCSYAAILNNAAMTCLAAGDLPMALEHAQRGTELAQQLGMAPFLFNFLDTLAQVLLAQGELEQAETLLHQALEQQPFPRPDAILASIYRNLGQACLERGDFDTAVAHIREAATDYESLAMRGEQARCCLLLSRVHERRGDFAAALAQYQAYDSLREAVAGKDVARRMAALRSAYEMELARRDSEIQRLRNVELQSEIEERKRIQVALEKLATTDMLTDMYNRRHFFSLAAHEVERAQRYNRPLSALMLDIDHFKEVNDRCGHIAGDQVLMAIGATIRAALRDVDVAGRYGGEEFSILLPETPEENALAVAERIRAAIADQFIQTDCGVVTVTVSIGVAGLVRDGQAVQLALAGLLDRADRALYAVKRDGRNRIRLYAP